MFGLVGAVMEFGIYECWGDEYVFRGRRGEC